ncbi:alpha-glycosidase [Roseburia hominis]|uniref:glycoside hydrolase family 13 protein n=1 Tax=Roseburia hominis TaxID=301301 RepID=UPI001F28B0B3|nr:alpha-glycosidase [Roseburia hominis]
MNECAMLHIPDSRYCFATGEKELVLRLRMAREDEKAKVFLIYAQKYDFTFCRKKLPMEIKYSDRLYNYYEIKMRLEDVRFAYIFQIEEDGNTWYFSEDGVTKEYKFEEAFYNFFQMPYINKNDVMDTVEWMRSAVFYQIFVERFRQGNEKKDTSYINMKWDEKPTPKSFAGGDLAGIIEKMDYLKELGINALYLTPVFRSISNHKYDIIDYFTVDPQFGTKEELRQLVKLAHENGIRVVLDAVFNHCSMEMQQFQDVLEKGRESRFYDWFIIDGDFPEPEKMNYECFAACNYMPKLNTANEEVQDFLLEIAIYWIREADIDGWRLDVSDEVSHGFWRRFRKAVKKEKPDSVIIGENWHDAYAYLMGDQYDSIMNYAFTKACLDYFAKGVFSAKDMADKLNSNLMRNTEQVNRMMLNLLDSHDTHRFFTEVNKDKDKMLAAIALEMVFEGAPCLYYGTELCMEGGYDPDSRRGFPWDTKSWDMDFLEKVKELIRIRKQPAVQYGEIKIEEEQEMLHVERMWENSKIILRINMTEEEKKIPKQPEETVLCEDNRFLITITEA